MLIGTSSTISKRMMLSNRGTIYAGDSAICEGQGVICVNKGVIWIGKGVIRASQDFGDFIV